MNLFCCILLTLILAVNLCCLICLYVICSIVCEAFAESEEEANNILPMNQDPKIYKPSSPYKD